MVISEVHIRRFKGIKDIHLDNFGDVNAFYGRNNSGKSTILHALDMAGLALTTKNWNAFQLKVQIEDLFHKAGPFEMGLTYSDGSCVTIRQQEGAQVPHSIHNQPQNRVLRVFILYLTRALGFCGVRIELPEIL